MYWAIITQASRSVADSYEGGIRFIVGEMRSNLSSLRRFPASFIYQPPNYSSVPSKLIFLESESLLLWLSLERDLVSCPTSPLDAPHFPRLTLAVSMELMISVHRVVGNVHIRYIMGELT